MMVAPIFAPPGVRAADGGRLPILLRIENPTQVPMEFDRGLGLMHRFGMPLIAVEFEQGLDYVADPEKIAEVAGKVSITVVMRDEKQYIGGRTIDGTGPRVLAAK